jgi:bifunctional UDP-N-acetylglucosamine pyrophosphorylase / glucosamine-1-phosphate N-acetyltransferase
MADRTCLAVILAAGEGTRMKSDLPKVLHPLAGRSMLGHVIHTVSGAGIADIAVVVGPGRGDVADEVRRLSPKASIFVQKDRLGTAHAVLAASEAVSQGYDDLLILFADTPLIQSSTLTAMRARLGEGHGVVALGFDTTMPDGYGRLLTDGSALVAIREHKDATETERQVTLCNSGLMAVDGRKSLELLSRIGNANSQKEFYLTDLVAEARKSSLSTAFELAAEDEVMGVNDRSQLAKAEAILQNRLREKAMLQGATLIDPATVYFSIDTRLGRDVIIEPNVFFGPGVVIGDRVDIRAFSHIEEAYIASHASIGPFARIRPGTKIGEHVKIGNFVELKKATLHHGVKVSHLSYIGDAEIGADANIGAGTITCNYDGFFKYKTTIGAGAFIGANSALVAPISIGAGAIVGSGSVITKNVEPDQLAVARGKQIVKDGWGAQFRATSLKKKAASAKAPS